MRHLAWSLSTAILGWLRLSAWIWRPRGGYFFLYRDLDAIRRAHRALTNFAIRET